MIRYLDKNAGHRLAFVPTANDTKSTGVGISEDGETYLIGFNFHNITEEGDGINFTFASTYDLGVYIDSVLIYLKAVSELDNDNQDLYKKWINELSDIQHDVIHLDSLLPAYKAVYGGDNKTGGNKHEN